jgi:hypothetical protein
VGCRSAGSWACRGRNPTVALEAQVRIDAPKLYEQLYPAAVEEAQAETLGWLVAAAYGYQELRAANTARVRWMSGLLTLLGFLMVVQTLLWLVALR